jgi:hypothetical protein
MSEFSPTPKLDQDPQPHEQPKELEAPQDPRQAADTLLQESVQLADDLATRNRLSTQPALSPAEQAELTASVDRIEHVKKLILNSPPFASTMLLAPRYRNVREALSTVLLEVQTDLNPENKPPEERTDAAKQLFDDYKEPFDLADQINSGHGWMPGRR